MLILAATVLVLAAVLVAAFSLGSDDRDDDASGSGNPTSAPTSTASGSPTKTTSLASFTGDSNKTTATFRAAANWEIRWKAPAGSGFTVELLNKDGDTLGQVVTGKKETHGSVFVSQAGEFKLKVAGSRPWSVQVVGKAR